MKNQRNHLTSIHKMYDRWFSPKRSCKVLYRVGFDELYAPKTPLATTACTSQTRRLGKLDKFNNNIVERFNGTQRRCYGPRRGLKRRNSPMFPGFCVWYNSRTSTRRPAAPLPRRRRA